MFTCLLNVKPIVANTHIYKSTTFSQSITSSQSNTHSQSDILINDNSKCDHESLVNIAHNTTLKFTTKDFVYQSYLHVAPVDKANNMGKIFSIRLNFASNPFSQSNTFTRLNSFTISFSFGLISTSSIIFYSSNLIIETMIQKHFILYFFMPYD